MNPQLEKVLELVKLTGERCIILDQTSAQTLVVMNLADYERLVKQPKERWPDEESSDLPETAEITSRPVLAKPEITEAEQFYFEPVEG